MKYNIRRTANKKIDRMARERLFFLLLVFGPPPLIFAVEAGEKVPKQIFERDAEKSDPIECATINDLMLGKGQVTPENIVLTRQKDFFYRLVSP